MLAKLRGSTPARVVVLAAAAAACGAPPAAATTRAQVQTQLRSIVNGMPGTTSVYVREAATQTVLASRAPTVKRIPASVTKLFATSTALLTDGPATRLATELRTTGEIDEGGVLRGDLVVRASGDPSFKLAQISELAEAARKAGITRIDGELRADLNGWTSQQGTSLTGGAYNREIGGRIGALVTLRGFASASVTDPARQVLVRLRDALRSRGVGGTIAFGGSAPSGDSEVIGTVRSPTIAELAAATNSPSDNFYAEMLLRGVGARHGAAGTTPAGLAVARETLGKLGVSAQLADGSGLSRGNRVAPTTIVRLLDQMGARAEGPALRNGLALAGSTGTLAGRMRGTAAAGRCRAKTGTLSNVSALAGWCTTVGKRTVSFAILMNNVNVASARRYQDRAAAAIAAWSDRVVVAEEDPQEPIDDELVPPSSPIVTTPTATTPAATTPGVRP